MAVQSEPGSVSYARDPERFAKVIVDLVLGDDPRTAGMMAGWDVELALQKLMFFTTPADFRAVSESVAKRLGSKFEGLCDGGKKRCLSFMIRLADSLTSPVELDHNLQSKRLFCETDILSDADARKAADCALTLAIKWEEIAPKAAQAALLETKLEDSAINKGDNLFAGWAREWEKAKDSDPYGSVAEFIRCFSSLYQVDCYYPALYFARENGETKTQFFNDYGMQAARCRRMGSLGGTTNPAIAILGENDLNGEGNIWGEDTISFIKSYPNRWSEIRKVIAKEQVAQRQPDDWGALKFTEWVVVDAMLGLRSVFLLRGLGRVAFQLRPDWHSDEKALTYAGGEIYKILCDRVRIFDDILLEAAGEPYAKTAAPRVGKSNNHFKVACTGQTCLNVVKAFNAGFHPTYPDALSERMFTNVTLSYDVPQMVAASLATDEGIKDYEKRTGEKVDDGDGGSVVTSMIGRFNDAIRDYRVKSLLAAVGNTDIDPASIKSLKDPKLNNAQFIAAAKSKGIEFDPEAEEDAVDRAGTLLTKRTVLLLESKYGQKRTRILTASKRNFFQNTELLDVPFSTDFGNIQHEYLKRRPVVIESWKTIYDDMNPDGTPKAESIWAKRDAVLRRIWPDWAKSWEIGGVKPSEYAGSIYVPPTLRQFIGFWNENVLRAAKAREEAEKA